MNRDWSPWIAAITAITAIVALLQTKQQIKLSNKQHLFDKRVEHYLLAQGLIQLYQSQKTLLVVNEDEPLLSVNFIFAQMTNNLYLENITDVIAHTLEQPYHKEFLSKMEKLREISTQIKFIFGGKEAALLGNFVLRYQELLYGLYQYQILLKNMNKIAVNFRDTLENAQEKVGEREYRKKMLKIINDLNQSYERIIKAKVEEKIEKQIKLS